MWELCSTLTNGSSTILLYALPYSYRNYVALVLKWSGCMILAFQFYLVQKIVCLTGTMIGYMINVLYWLPIKMNKKVCQVKILKLQESEHKRTKGPIGDEVVCWVRGQTRAFSMVAFDARWKYICVMVPICCLWCCVMLNVPLWICCDARWKHACNLAWKLFLMVCNLLKLCVSLVVM
jgi:hypothetical protein